MESGSRESKNKLVTSPVKGVSSKCFKNKPSFNPKAEESVPSDSNDSKHEDVTDIKPKDDYLDEVDEKTYKEHQIESKLNEMENIWEKVDFEILPVKNNDTYIMSSMDKIQNLLDEHMFISQAIQFSAFKKPFEVKIEEWVSTLIRIQDVLEQWEKCQVNLMYLQSVFDSKDIMEQLPNETEKISGIDQIWRNLMSQVKQNPNVIEICKYEGRLESFIEANKILEVVQKELNNYLETKRAVFARFYFLSNDELLSILSETKDPTRIRPYLCKVFENIQRLEFKENQTIHSMFSSEGEQVAFVKPVNPNEKNVEFWMCDLEDMMKISVRNALLVSIEDYKRRPRNDWVLVHPGQCVINGSQVHWTTEVEDAIKEGADSVVKYHKFLETQLLDTVKLIRGDLTNMQSFALEALIVIDVHAKDVVWRLVENKVDSVDDFDWIAQLRYYWGNDDCYVKCIQTCFPYGYEYLGNSPRLVITPLTDKCYMTLMGALNLGLGGAPVGPAGTGKTESVKDLSKALAKQIVIFNCSDDMDYVMVAKFFKGLASSGAWACFDEFNRIYIEVLSVIAQQLNTLLERKHKGDTEFEFEGSTIRIQPTFSVFITMNPGYAGRTELPDSLKSLFRPVAMMVPNYAMIGEIMLYSFGFTKARELAKKIVETFKLCSVLLSSQSHYDYGIKAVRSVINAAGLIKRAEPDMDEEQLLLKALRDMNAPKFLRDDLLLFESIISDLFPHAEKLNINRKPLDQALIDTCAKLNIQPEQAFIDKIFQLYDTTKVRHGLMIVGLAGGGKTSNYVALSKALSSIKHINGFFDVFVHVLNPKSITMGQLYGKFDELTHEWTDGILNDIMRKCVRDQYNPPFNNKHWVMFDGPIDALWIENMNTVLDDNKKLCLNSGEIIALSPHMTMMFEVEDLSVASPATVSRCGMVYMEPISLGLYPLVKSWINTLPSKVKDTDSIVTKLNQYFDIYAFPMIKFVRENLIEPVASIDSNLTQSIFRILNCYMVKYHDTEVKNVSQEKINELEIVIENLFVYAVTWTLGVTTNSEGRKRFDKHFREILVTRTLSVPFPDTETVYDWYFDENNKVYKSWTETIPAYDVDPSGYFNEIVVPTMDSIRTKFLYKLLLINKYHVLSPGPTGTGKSVNSSSLLSCSMPENFQYITLTFSAKTSANQIQDLIDSKVEKKRNRVYGPPTGKYYVIFIDDLNMPKKEKYGTQPPLELLRQWMDHKGWYDHKEKTKREIVDIMFLSTMGTSEGGQSTITNRLVRHFNLITYTLLEESDITMIYSKILNAYLQLYVEPIRQGVSQFVIASLSLYEFVEKTFLPTPDKPHYTFNLRDLAHVFEGLCSSQPKVIGEYITMVRLWCHENLRVFGDRLTNPSDLNTLMEALGERVKENFGLDPKEVFIRERLIFGHFLNQNLPEDRIYEEVKNTGDMMKMVNEYLESFNDRYPKRQMKLVMFLDACCHVAKICRILRQPMGNALLLGVGGSGRQSMSKLSAFIMETELRQIEITKSYSMKQWRDDLKSVLKYAGIKNEKIIFLLVDTQIIDEQMLDDINNVLNSGDVPNIYETDDWEDIISIGRPECQRKGLQPTDMNIMSQFIGRIKKNIHIILAMSPIGEAFRSRLRMFPSLINCCSIDWFTDWPEEALISVAKSQLTEDNLNIDNSLEQIAQFFKTVHKSVEQTSTKFLNELRRHVYITPTSYLELIRCFKSLLVDKRNQLQTEKQRFSKGAGSLIKAAQDVEIMKLELTEIMPKLAEVQIQSEQMMEKIVRDKAEAKLKAETSQIDALEADYEAIMKKQEYLKYKINDCEIKLERAEKLIGGLSGEQVRWTKESESLADRIEKLPGDCALSAGIVGYTGAFTGIYRQQLENKWRKTLLDLEINHTAGVTMRATLEEPIKIQQWKVAGLPNDSVSIENGIIIEKSRRWSLIIDPQGRANSFIKKLGKEHEEGIEFCKASDGNIIRNLGTAIMNGKWFLIENVNEELDPALEPILLQQVVREGAGYSIRIGDKSVEYNKNFRFFMTTTLNNPHYSPETCVKVTLLNFAITPEGLEEQMLDIVVDKENPKLEETKSLLITQNVKSQRKLKQIEVSILEHISSSEGNILDNQELINILNASKIKSTNIMIKVEKAKEIEKEIDSIRESYRPVAFRASLLFFCIMNLSNVDPMYQYSLQWFIRLFKLGIDNTPNPGGHEERLVSLNEYFTYSLYKNICQSLFEKHKLLFSFILTMKILDGYKEIDLNEWGYMLTGPQKTIEIPPNPTSWLNDNTWKSIYEEVNGLDNLEHFKGFEHYFVTHTDNFRSIFDAFNAHEEPLPGDWNTKLNDFQKMLVLKAIRPDRMVAAVQNWVIAKLGKKFVIQSTFDLPAIYQDSGVKTPLICVLSPGSDPISAIIRFAKEKGMSQKLNSCSLGQGQGEKAKKHINDAKNRGEWVLLQNCHLAASWMPALERIVEEFDDSLHQDFRLWLTSMPTKEFPVSILQNGIKMTIEPPQSLRSNLLQTYSKIDDKTLEDCSKPEAYKTLYFGFCFFHAIVQERRKFGPIGWNVEYEFTFEDLDVTLKQLKLFLNQDTNIIPYKALNILSAEINYGGRVTDDKDLRLINAILRNYINESIFDEEYKFSTSGKYFAPPPGCKEDYVKYIESLDLNPEPEVFGLHDNAEIITAQGETRKVLETILLMQPRTEIGIGKSCEDIIREIAKGIELNLPSKFNIEDIASKYPTQYNESMNTVLFQEVIKFQRLLSRMELSLRDVQKALSGKIFMSEDLELVANAMYDNKVPEIWANVGFLSLKPLSSWFVELKERIKFLNDWILNGTPNVFWISGFFFPQAFITGTLQNFGRKHMISIDHLSFDFIVKDDLTLEEIKEKPADGCYIYGLWLEGARWDSKEHSLAWSLPKDLYTQMPIIHLLPIENRVSSTTGVYFCPIYKVLSRRGTLSTTGHSTNFVLFIELVSKVSQDVWIRAGVAAFLSLRS